jgi:chemotaxis protein MotB
MDNSAPTAPIIIVKKKGGHAGHHGGAWKVAYADFVTAMMALFIVLWLLNTNQKVQEAVSGYFKDPKGYKALAGTGAAGSGEALAVDRGDMERLSEKLQQAMSKMPEFQKIKDQVEVTVTGEGLRVELLETETGVFFETGSPKPSLRGEEMIRLVAGELGRLPNEVVIEGHTDSRPFSNEASYGNWELSADRSNAARRLMESSGLRANQIVQVRGFADRNLRAPGQPHDASNRRVSIIVRYPNEAAKPAAAKDPGKPSPMPEAKKAGGHH